MPPFHGASSAALKWMARMKEELMPPERVSQAVEVPGDSRLLETLAGRFVRGMGAGVSDISSMPQLPPECSSPFQVASSRAML